MAEEQREEKKQAPSPPPDREVSREGTVHIAGRQVRYRSVAGTYTVKDEEGAPKATIFAVAYTRTDVDDQARRPLTFAFNGGPGSSSVWLHMGLLGPRRVDIGDAITPPPPPYQVVDNDCSMLDLTDLVFIDPVSTGYSRAVEGEEAKQFHGVKEDVRWVGEFIRLHTTRTGRWESPKLLAGESYGTTRAAALSHHLQDKLGMNLNGVCLISSILMFQTARPEPGNDLPHLLYLPSYAATAWYHGLVRRDFSELRALTDAAEAFALGEYARVLLLGDRAQAAERTPVAEQVARFTGLSADFVERCNLRVAPPRFFKELLRGRRRTLGRLDSRFQGIDADAAGENAEYDPSYSVIQGPFTAAVNQYLRSELGFESDTPYEVLNGDKVQPWNFGDEGTNRYLDVASDLRAAMSRNRDLRVFVGSGYFDLATPFFAAEWTFDHMGLDPDLKRNVTFSRYDAGHMMYIHEPSRRELRKDLAQFVEASLPAAGGRRDLLRVEEV